MNNNKDHQNMLKDNNIQLVFAMVELQLKYLFYVLEEGIEKDFDKALMGYTSIISKMKMVPSFKEENEDWQYALESIKNTYSEYSYIADRTAFAQKAIKILTPFLYSFALIPEPIYEWFGCFRYNYDSKGKHIYLHFKNACSPESPFASPCDRLKDLFLLVKDIQNKHLSPETVGCDSWLNELEVFQNFFPSEYLESFAVSPPDSKAGYGWWGQFVGKDGCFNKSKAEKFEKYMEFQYRRIIAKCSYKSFVRYISYKYECGFRKTLASNQDGPCPHACRASEIL